MMQTVLITGASKGIGKATYQKLSGNPLYRFFLVGRSEPELLNENSMFVCADLADSGSVEKAIAEIKSIPGYNGIDILVNNAGTGHFKKVEDILCDDWNRVIHTNLTAPYLFIKSFISGMKEKNFGRIINISSDADHIGFAEAGVYCASKFGLLGLSQAIRQELIGTNVAITTISPGRVDTHFNNKQPGARPVSLKPEDIAEQISCLLQMRGNCNIESIRMKSTLE